MMIEQYIQRHKEICIAHNTLCISTKKLHEGCPNVSSTLDEMLTVLSDSTFIVSPAHVNLSPSDEIKIFEQKVKSRFFVLRIPIESKDTQDTSANHRVSFLQKLASLSFSKTNPEMIHHSSLIEKDLICFAARAIKYQIIEQQQNLEVIPSVLISPPQHQHQDRSIFSPLRYMSKAKAIVNNILGSYPDDHQFTSDTSDFDKNVDDAILRMDQRDLDDHFDDAHVTSTPNTHNPKLVIDNHILSNNDVQWNIELIIDCWRIIIKCAQERIKRKMEDGDDEHQLTTICHHDKKLTGLFLYRDGDDRNSFSSFCRDCGVYFAQEGGEYSQKVLQTLKSGMTMDVMIALLLETNKAIETQDRDIIILVPTLKLGNEFISDGSSVNEVELCIFKLGTTIHSIEVRIERLGKQAENARLKALAGKNSGSNKQAVLHMKRRQDYLREVERSSTLLLNLDSGLMSLKRAMSDKEVIRSYELMNNTMKSIRQDIDISHAEDIMIEYEDLNNEFQSLHDAINFDLKGNEDDVESDELLLKELNSLTIGELHNSKINESSDVSSDPLGDTDLSTTPSRKDQDQEEKILLPA